MSYFNCELSYLELPLYRLFLCLFITIWDSNARSSFFVRNICETIIKTRTIDIMIKIVFLLIFSLRKYYTKFFNGDLQKVAEEYKMIRQDSIIAGAGFILLTLWAIIFVNIFLTNPHTHDVDWHKRLEPYDYSSKVNYNSAEKLLLLSTTLMAPEVRNLCRFSNY